MLKSLMNLDGATSIPTKTVEEKDLAVTILGLVAELLSPLGLSVEVSREFDDILFRIS